YALRVVEFGAGGRAAVTGEPGAAVPGDGVDVAGGHRLAVVRAGLVRHHPDPVVEAVGDQQVAGGVHRHLLRVAEFGAGGRAAVAQSVRAATGDGVDVADGHRLPVEGAGAGCHHPDPAVEAV